MAYEPTTWAAGDVVTSAKLNKLEQGVAAASGILLLHETVDGNTYILDHTWQEIHDAMTDGIPVLMIVPASDNLGMITGMVSVIHGGANYSVYVDGDFMEFTTDSSDGYPSYTSENPSVG